MDIKQEFSRDRNHLPFFQGYKISFLSHLTEACGFKGPFKRTELEENLKESSVFLLSDDTWWHSLCVKSAAITLTVKWQTKISIQFLKRAKCKIGNCWVSLPVWHPPTGSLGGLRCAPLAHPCERVPLCKTQHHVCAPCPFVSSEIQQAWSYFLCLFWYDFLQGWNALKGESQTQACVCTNRHPAPPGYFCL